jgi:hypothetical protein
MLAHKILAGKTFCVHYVKRQKKCLVKIYSRALEIVFLHMPQK